MDYGNLTKWYRIYDILTYVKRHYKEGGVDLLKLFWEILLLNMEDTKVPVKLESADITQILIAVLIITFTLVLIALYKRRKTARRGILITGLCDSGKTLIYSRLLHNKHVQTHTSIKENTGNYIVNNDVLKIIDIPGHERLRDKFFEQYKAAAKGIVFVVDSLTLQQDIRDAAEFLYNILVDNVIINNAPNVLILCNKQDQTLAKGANAIKSTLEKELNTLRITKSSQLESVDPKAKHHITLGDPYEEFYFSALYLKVDFAECYAYNKNGSTNLDELTNWLTKLA